MKTHLLLLIFTFSAWTRVSSGYVLPPNFEPANNWRLPKSVLPIYYDLKLKTYLPGYGWKEDENAQRFEGTITIDLAVVESTDKIVLHSDSLRITDASIKSNDTELDVESIRMVPDLQFLVLHLNKEVKPETNVQISLDFDGKLNQDLRGYYISQSSGLPGAPNKLNAVTQFETTDARFMVPCFDEPEFKAMWHVELIHPTGTTALTNTDQIWVEDVADGWTITTFGQTVKMSSYLLAIFIGDLDYKETQTDSGVRIRVYAPPSRIDDVDYALNVSRITVEGFEKHFNIEYPMDKIDFVAVRDFAYGAMENWGLITHGFAYIFGETDQVAGTVIHELAHQWFGNLVTMDFWNNIFLNEAFASYMTAKGFSFLRDGFDEDFYNSIGDQNDGFKKDTQFKIREYTRQANGNIETPILVYSKGSSFIRMLAKIVGQENFDNGIRWYLSEHQYKNANEKDLYNALEKFTPSDVLGADGYPLDLEEFASCWTDQNGYPTLHVEKTSWGTIRLTQQIDNYREEGFRNGSACGYRWDIPIWYQEKGSEEIKFMWFGKEQFNLELDTENTPIFNANSNGFYRVSYSNDLLSQIASALESNELLLSNSTKYRIVRDAAGISMGDSGKIKNVVRIAKVLSQDPNHDVADLAVNALYFAEKKMEAEGPVNVNPYVIKEQINKIMTGRSNEIVADCNSTEPFHKCMTRLATSENFDLTRLCLNEKFQAGRSRVRLLEFLKSEKPSGFRGSILQLIGCSDEKIFQEIMNDEEYGLTDEEKEYVRNAILNGSATESRSRSLMPARSFYKKARI